MKGGHKAKLVHQSMSGKLPPIHSKPLYSKRHSKLPVLYESSLQHHLPNG